MLFRKEIEPRCSYCKYAAPIDQETIACVKKGVLSAGSACSRFSYDPFKRTPPAPAVPDFSRLKEEDFSL